MTTASSGRCPPKTCCATSWTGGNVEWLRSDFQSVILNPLLSMLSARQLTNQIDYVVLCMDFPYRVTDTNGANSTTTALFYGFVPDDPAPGPGLPASCSLPSVSSNSYAGSEYPFRSVAPGTSKTNFLTVMLTSSNLAQAKPVIDGGAASDGTFPTQTVYLAKSSDVNRNIRYALFDNAVFNTRLRGNYSMQRTNADPRYSFGAILGLQSGWGQSYLLGSTSFVPGALADNLTSWGGTIFEDSGQVSIIALLNAGAAGCYGTVTEPCEYLQKFPSAQAFFYQARGFSMAECYYQSVTNPYQGLLLGEPLAAPFALAPGGAWNNLPANALLSGTTNLSLQINAADTNHPVQQVDLFVDGTFAQTLTNISPRQNNVLTVTIRGQPMPYTVPASATLPSVTTGLTALLNNTSNTNATKVRAFAHGDRIELQSFDITQLGSAGFALGHERCRQRVRAHHLRLRQPRQFPGLPLRWASALSPCCNAPSVGQLPAAERHQDQWRGGHRRSHQQCRQHQHLDARADPGERGQRHPRPPRQRRRCRGGLPQLRRLIHLPRPGSICARSPPAGTPRNSRPPFPARPPSSSSPPAPSGSIRTFPTSSRATTFTSPPA